MLAFPLVKSIPARLQIGAFLAFLVLLDVALSSVALGWPGAWTAFFYGLPYHDPYALLLRMGAVWVAFVLVQMLALLRWQAAPEWLAVVAGVRLTEILSDWIPIAFAEQRTTLGTIALFVAPPANLLFGVLLLGTYRRLIAAPSAPRD